MGYENVGIGFAAATVRAFSDRAHIGEAMRDALDPRAPVLFGFRTTASAERLAQFWQLKAFIVRSIQL